MSIKTNNIQNIIPPNGLGSANFLDSLKESKKINPSSKTTLQDEKIKYYNFLDLQGNVGDYNFYVDDQKNVFYSKRINNGFSSSNPNLIKIDKKFDIIRFNDDISKNYSYMNLSSLANSHSYYNQFYNNKLKDPVRLNYGTDKSELYRGINNYFDYVEAGGGNDQFRLEKLDTNGDFFDGEDGLDTLYLSGKLADYKFIQEPNGSVKVIYKDPKKGTGFIYISNVERIRFSKGVGDSQGLIAPDAKIKNGYVNLSDIVKE